MGKTLRVVDHRDVGKRYNWPNAGHRHKPSCRAVLLRQSADCPIANNDLLKQALTHCHDRGNNTIDSQLPLGQLLHPLSDVPAATFANHQTECLQDTAQLVVGANAHVNQLVPR
jgi:hypothetical protein